MIIETDRSGAKYTYIKLTDQEKAVLTEELRITNIKLRTLQLDSGSLKYQYLKNLEGASVTFAAEMVSVYLQQQVLSAGEEGNSVQCESEYIRDYQFKPAYKSITDLYCPAQATMSQPMLRTQTNAKAYEQGAVGYFLCNEFYEPVPNNTNITLRIKNAAGDIVAQHSSKTSNLIQGIENFNINNIVLPSEPGKYTIEIDAATEYDGQFLEGKYRYEIDIVAPSVRASFVPKDQCGSGEQLDYILNMNSSIAYPIIFVEKNKYTPFSMPYVPQKKIGYRFVEDSITLKQISSCNVTGLMSWNQELRRFESLDTGSEIESGKGYFIKSLNDCSILFDSSRFS